MRYNLWMTPNFSFTLCFQSPPVTVTMSTGVETICYQTAHGMAKHNTHGASYPSTFATHNTGGSVHVKTHDACMSVRIIKTGFPWTNGYYQDSNGADCPTSDEDWPNTQMNGNCYLAVWLK